MRVGLGCSCWEDSDTVASLKNITFRKDIMFFLTTTGNGLLKASWQTCRTVNFCLIRYYTIAFCFGITSVFWLDIISFHQMFPKVRCLPQQFPNGVILMSILSLLHLFPWLIGKDINCFSEKILFLPESKKHA